MKRERFLPTRLGLLLSLLASAAGAQNTRYLDPVFSGVDVTTDIEYSTAFDLGGNLWELKLDLYEPAGDTAATRPAVVVVHGGGLLSGSKSTLSFVDMATRMAQRGYVAISIDYRLAANIAEKNLFYDQIVANAKEDFQAAVQSLRLNAAAWRIDTDRITTMGASAGATTNLEGTYNQPVPQSVPSSELHACVDMWGILNSLDTLQAGDPPLFIVHGTQDMTVPFQHALDLKAQAELVGVPLSWNPMPGIGHSPWNLFWTNHFDPCLEFLYEHLELGKLSGLRALPGHSSPGTLTLEAHGIAGDQRLLGWALGSGSLSLEPLGVLCLDPASMGLMNVLPIPQTTGVDAQTTSASIPAGWSGLELHFQELHSTASGEPRLLTNCIEVVF